MKKLFISQPMRDKTDEQIEIERSRVITDVKKLFPNEKIAVIDSFFDGESKTPLWYLGESIKLLGKADFVYFCKDWDKYRGCCVEHECCVKYDINFVEE